MRRDNRRINQVWQSCNRLGEWYTFALVGSGKNSKVVTLSNGAMANYYQDSIGNLYRKFNHPD